MLITSDSERADRQFAAPAEPGVVALAGTHDPAFTRVALLAEGLREHGIPVVPLAEPAWGGTASRVDAARRGIANPGLALRLLRAQRRVARRIRALSRPPRALLLGYPGQLDVPVLRALFPRLPIVLDGFVSLDETLADRGIGAPWTATRVLARAIDRLAFRLADLVVVDTAAHARRFAATCGLHPSKVVVAPVGARDPAGLSTPGKTAGPSAPLSTSGLHVLYFGGFIPLHGVPVVLDAARHLAGEEGVRFELVGDGQDAELAERQVGAWGLDRVQVRRTWMPEAELVQRHVRVADVCLGIFADRPKTMDVVPAKLYLALACGCPVVTADTPAVREEILAHAPPAEPPVLLCPPGDGRALARALLRLRDDPELRAALARRGRALYERRFTPACIAADLARAIEAFHGRSSAPR